MSTPYPYEETKKETEMRQLQHQAFILMPVQALGPQATLMQVPMMQMLPQSSYVQQPIAVSAAHTTAAVLDQHIRNTERIAQLESQSRTQAAHIAHLESQNRILSQGVLSERERIIALQNTIVSMNEDFSGEDDDNVLSVTQERDNYYHQVQELRKILSQKNAELNKCIRAIAALQRDNKILVQEHAVKDRSILELKAILDDQDQGAKERADAGTPTQTRTSDAMSEASSLGFHVASILQSLDLDSVSDDTNTPPAPVLFRGPTSDSSSTSPMSGPIRTSLDKTTIVPNNNQAIVDVNNRKAADAKNKNKAIVASSKQPKPK